jgi:hypothetical protein
VELAVGAPGAVDRVTRGAAGRPEFSDMLVAEREGGPTTGEGFAGAFSFLPAVGKEGGMAWRDE